MTNEERDGREGIHAADRECNCGGSTLKSVMHSRYDRKTATKSPQPRGAIFVEI